MLRYSEVYLFKKVGLLVPVRMCTSGSLSLHLQDETSGIAFPSHIAYVNCQSLGAIENYVPSSILSEQRQLLRIVTRRELLVKAMFRYSDLFRMPDNHTRTVDINNN